MTLKLSDPDLARLRLEAWRVAVEECQWRVGRGARDFVYSDITRTAEEVVAFALNPPPDAPAESES